MTQLSKNFNSKEFECKCGCGHDAVHPQLVYELQMYRDRVKKPISINSGCRCHTHNQKVGGSIGSKHIPGLAADIVVEGVDPSDVASYFMAKYQNSYGIGKYTNFTHIDVRQEKARWDKRQVVGA